MKPYLSDALLESGVSWIFVGGKGGVGKTSTSAALAVELARRNRSVLLISTDPAHNLSDTFAQQFSGEPTLVNGVPCLYAMEVDNSSLQNSSIKELVGILRDSSRTVFGGTLFGRSEGFSQNEQDGSDDIDSTLEKLTSSVPGIDEALAFATMIEYVENMRFDIVIFDTAPTGHTLRLLNFPNLLDRGLTQVWNWSSQFGGIFQSMGSLLGLQNDSFGQLANKLERLRDLTQKVIQQFRDPRKTTFVAVCIPEFLPVYETERLLQDLKKFDIDCKYIVVNHVINESIRLGMNPEDLFSSRVQVQNKYIEKIRDLYAADFHVTKLPLLPYEVRGLSTISTFAKLLLGTNNPFYKEFLKKESLSLDIEEYPPTLQNLLEEDSLRWIFIGGKGGVGKTSVSSALATLLSERTEGRVLLVSTDPAHNLSDAFNQSFSSSPTTVDGNSRLDVMEVSPNVEELFAQDQDGGLPFDLPGFGDFGNLRDRIRNIFSDMISSIPGIDEAISFGHIVRFIRSKDYKVVVFDTAPTGHTLRLLSFPSVLDSGLTWLSSIQEQYLPLLQSAAAMMQNSNTSSNQNFSPRDIENLLKQKLQELKATIETVQEQFRDPNCTTFVCVTIAEALSIYETERLVQQLASYDMDCRNIVVNQLFDPEEEQKREMLLLRAKMQQKYLDQVEELYSSDSLVIKAPLLPKELYGLESLQMFANYLQLP
ncbi:hypothetical protein GpartN1_g5434.t1 [Galdieria partita]|uniref:AAA+ ATPase domain-containing protein n=1 Tax=Galdieria partita TaxID=83374 RepID=A0A9C7USB7_9RHOD|nr:hypothetical protein GpartN1_g5434.t1 [Galdieria partita]